MAYLHVEDLVLLVEPADEEADDLVLLHHVGVRVGDEVDIGMDLRVSAAAGAAQRSVKSPRVGGGRWFTRDVRGVQYIKTVKADERKTNERWRRLVERVQRWSFPGKKACSAWAWIWHRYRELSPTWHASAPVPHRTARLLPRLPTAWPSPFSLLCWNVLFRFDSVLTTTRKGCCFSPKYPPGSAYLCDVWRGG